MAKQNSWTIQATTVLNQRDLHIDLHVHISPDFTSEQIEIIFADMAKHLYKVDNS